MVFIFRDFKRPSHINFLAFQGNQDYFPPDYFFQNKLVKFISGKFFQF